MIRLFRLLLLQNKYGSGRDGDAVIDEKLYLLGNMEYNTLAFVGKGQIVLNGYSVKVLLP